MNQRIIAVAGVSGVGKSTFIKQLSDEFLIQHLQASFLIKEGARLRDIKGLEQDALRGLDIDENQALLIYGFKHHKDEAAVIVLDCHTVIDSPNGFVSISPVIFKEIGVSHMIFLTDSPEAIAARRNIDQSRARPKRSVAEIDKYQFESFMHGYKITQEIGVPFTVCKLGCAKSLKNFFT